MTPEPPASSEGSPLPPRHRPSLGNLAQDTTEIDLWAFEDDLDLPGGTDEPVKLEPSRPASGGDIPSPRERPPMKPRDAEGRSPANPAGGEEQIRMNVTKSRAKNRPTGANPEPLRQESEFDDLEHWEDVVVEPEIEELPAVELQETTGPTDSPVRADTTEIPVQPASEPEPESPAPDDEFAPAPREGVEPMSLRPHLGLSKVERVGLIALLVVLVGGGATVFISSLNRLPVEAVKAESADFPIKGEFVTISSASSYWRAPVTEGPDADTFRRGTELLPVLELTAKGGPAAIRILFRSDDGTVVGDAVTRPISGAGSLKIPATAGFDDPGMHAAYRTGESKPWTIEVFEARSEDATGKDFKKLFEMNISTDRH